MSNEVVWRLLGGEVLSLLKDLGFSRLFVEVVNRGEEHPLILHIERGLRELFRPDGALSCPQLGERIAESTRENPDMLRIIIKGLVLGYVEREERLNRGIKDLRSSSVNL